MEPVTQQIPRHNRRAGRGAIVEFSTSALNLVAGYSRAVWTPDAAQIAQRVSSGWFRQRLARRRREFTPRHGRTNPLAVSDCVYTVTGQGAPFNIIEFALSMSHLRSSSEY
jgi:hypothetical protein